MSGTPKYKLFRGKEYIAACKYPEDVAVLISAHITDRVSYDRAIDVWTANDDPAIAAESYDVAADLMEKRIRAYNIRCARKLGYSDERIIKELNHDAEEVAAA